MLHPQCAECNAQKVFSISPYPTLQVFLNCSDLKQCLLFTRKCLLKNVWVSQVLWQLWHLGSLLSLDLHCRMWAYLLCIFVLPPTLIKIVNSGSFHWALSLFIFFVLTGLSRSCCRWFESKSIICSKGSLDFVHLCFTQSHPLEPELPIAKKYFLQYNSSQIECFLKKCICVNLSSTGID